MVTNFSWRKTWLAACLAAVIGTSLLIGLRARSSSPAYTITDLGIPGDTTAASGISADGLIIGTMTNRGEPHACVYQHGALRPLREPNGIGSAARNLNRHQQVVGALFVGSGYRHAVLWHNGVMTDLGTLGGSASDAFAINDQGEIVGFTDTNRKSVHAFVYREGQMQDLGTLGGGRSEAHGINNVAQIVGYSRIDRTTNHAFLWQNGMMTDLGTLGGNNSVASAINDQGTVIGTADTAEGEHHAFRWQAGVMQDLGMLPGGKESSALALNNRGQIIGKVQIEVYHRSGAHAWLYADGSLQDLNALIRSGSGWELEEARAINDQGQIVGVGIHNGQDRDFLLTPVSHGND
jgi:probable HAF family extracellular repeat protein